MPRLNVVEPASAEGKAKELFEGPLKGKHFNIFRGMANSPAALNAYLQLSGALQDGLLDQAVQHRRDAKLSHPAGRLGDFHPSHRLRFVGPVQQLFPDSWPMLFQVVGGFADSHPVNSRAPFVALDLPQCCLQVLSLTHFLQ